MKLLKDLESNINDIEPDVKDNVLFYEPYTGRYVMIGKECLKKIKEIVQKNSEEESE